MRIQRFGIQRFGIQRFGTQRFEGLSMVNLKPSKPLCQIVTKCYKTFISVKPYIQGYRGYMGYMYSRVCDISSEYPRLLAGNIGVYNKPSYIKPSYWQYMGYMRHGGLKV